MKAIATENRRRTSPSYIPLPWHIFAEFWRTVWVGCIVTFGPDPARTTYTRREEDSMPPLSRGSFQVKPIRH